MNFLLWVDELPASRSPTFLRGKKIPSTLFPLPRKNRFCRGFAKMCGFLSPNVNSLKKSKSTIYFLNGFFSVKDHCFTTRWAPTSYKWSYNPYKCLYKWVTGLITLLIGVTTLAITGDGAHLVGVYTSKILGDSSFSRLDLRGKVAPTIRGTTKRSHLVQTALVYRRLKKLPGQKTAANLVGLTWEKTVKTLSLKENCLPTYRW